MSGYWAWSEPVDATLYARFGSNGGSVNYVAGEIDRQIGYEQATAWTRLKIAPHKPTLPGTKQTTANAPRTY
jgi:hypothetical protein